MNKIKIYNNKEIEEFLEVDKNELIFALKNYNKYINLENGYIFMDSDKFDDFGLDLIECED